MTDEELIARLRDCGNGVGSFKTKQGDYGLCDDAADRIEALVKDKRWIMEERDRTFALMLERAEKAEARAERLEAALVEHNDLLRSALAIAKREGVEGQIASTNWDAYYNRVAVALKRHHQTANEARAALTQKEPTDG